MNCHVILHIFELLMIDNTYNTLIMKPIVAFAFQSAELFEYFDRKWAIHTYTDYGTWNILENELYDYMYRD